MREYAVNRGAGTGRASASNRTSTIRPAEVRATGGFAPGEHIVRVQGQAFNWPLVCACCGEKLTQGHKMNHVTGHGDAVALIRMADWKAAPTCPSCTVHAAKAHRANHLEKHGREAWTFVLSFSFLTGPAVLILLWILTGSGTFGFYSGLVAMAAAVGYAFWQKAQKARLSQQLHLEAVDAMGEKCCSSQPPVELQDSDGETHSFLFRNANYAGLFSSSNPDQMLI
jgi:hypothetical protein